MQGVRAYRQTVEGPRNRVTSSLSNGEAAVEARGVREEGTENLPLAGRGIKEIMVTYNQSQSTSTTILTFKS